MNLPPSAYHPSGWDTVGQREQVSQAERRDAVVARRRRSCKDRTEVREDTERRVQKEKQRDVRREQGTKGRGTHCLNEASGARKAELPNMVMLKQEAHVAACRP